MSLATSSVSSSAVNPTTNQITGRDLALAESGNIYIVGNTPGTPISGHAAPTTYDETKALLYVYNGSALNLFPLSLLLKLTTAGTNSTTVRFEQTISPTNRVPVGGSSLTPGGTGGQGAPTGVVVTFGAPVIGAAPAARQQLGGWQYRDVIGVVRDVYGFTWGAGNSDLVQMPQAVTNGTAEADIFVAYAAISVPPGYGFAIHQWSASQTVAMQFDPMRFEFALK